MTKSLSRILAYLLCPIPAIHWSLVFRQMPTPPSSLIPLDSCFLVISALRGMSSLPCLLRKEFLKIFSKNTWSSNFRSTVVEGVSLNIKSAMCGFELDSKQLVDYVFYYSHFMTFTQSSFSKELIIKSIQWNSLQPNGYNFFWIPGSETWKNIVFLYHTLRILIRIFLMSSRMQIHILFYLQINGLGI